MHLKLLALFLVLSLLVLPAHLETHDKHDKPGKKHRDTVEELLVEYDATEDPSDDDDDNDGEWIFELVEESGECNPNPCLNDGVCEEKWGGRFKCDCPKPFKGRRCEKVKKVCKKHTCGRGQCVLISLPPYYECKCKEPFQPPHCRTTATCDPNPCMNGGSCKQDRHDFDCICPVGFSGKFCKVGPDDCYEGDGGTYRGKVSETDDGHDCLYWNSHFILEKGTDPFSTFEDDGGLGPHNFCRNPDGDVRPWCFIRKGKKLRWDHCDVRQCSSPTAAPTTTPPGPQPTMPKPPAPEPTTEAPEPTTEAPAKPTTTAPVQTSAGPAQTTPAVGQQLSTCGKPQPRRSQNRIYGGLKAVPGAQPWQASLQVRKKGSQLDYRHICGGVLIKPCWVLTAAHCIDKNQEMKVVLGSLNLDKDEPTQQEVVVEEAIVHEKYKETSEAVYNDIALLRLKETDGQCINETQLVKTVCLPDGPFPDGTECTISGWGATPESASGSTQLLDAKVLLISQERCSDSKVYGSVLDQSMFCAGYLKGGVDSCQGDSGGPLTCEKEGTHFIYGIVSWGDSCGKENKPGVYTRVTHFTDWIASTTSSIA